MKKYISEREGQLDFFEKYNINFENNNDEDILKILLMEYIMVVFLNLNSILMI